MALWALALCALAAAATDDDDPPARTEPAKAKTPKIWKPPGRKKKADGRPVGAPVRHGYSKPPPPTVAPVGPVFRFAGIAWQRHPGAMCHLWVVHCIKRLELTKLEQCLTACAEDGICQAAFFYQPMGLCRLLGPNCEPVAEPDLAGTHLYISPQRKRVSVSVEDLRMGLPDPKAIPKLAARIQLANMIQTGQGAGKSLDEIQRLYRDKELPPGCARALSEMKPQPYSKEALGDKWMAEEDGEADYSKSFIPVTDEDLRVLGNLALISTKHRFILFGLPKVACSEWVRMFDRLWGHVDYNAYDPDGGFAVHFRFGERNRARLTMSMLDKEEATLLMNNKSWTRAVFFRDPAERILSAFLDKFAHNNSYNVRVFRDPKLFQFQDLVEHVAAEGYPPNGVGAATNVHWRSQMMLHHLYKFLPKFDFVGWSGGMNARLLLKRLQLWGPYGRHGWGNKSAPHLPDAFMGTRYGRDGHQTRARDRFRKHVTPRIEEVLRKAYRLDYAAFRTIGLVPGGAPVSGARWRPRAVRCPGPYHPMGNPCSCNIGRAIPRKCLFTLREFR
eukprot:TRINITY_DN282_c1_g1_i1.p1 TRINITY_DN282_c1_g1~~TRINITY_DN282_c1_g1_i1.p1  ORF type:complete len:585 (+),score=157.66 TRINITY_DN282_c1_g1_i1:80-1756(+)